ncbi:uncharacterized protein LOC121380047 [Gigantopelta aegis]|uniref:uncharacterized protein LOC121380047 n=1 Tax=Gigantopelta aegis TaxID=1735272 RepID=UPI001B88BC99|nr:uncharacterized protein LOC121380047 [Gigantopelta aegis]
MFPVAFNSKPSEVRVVPSHILYTSCAESETIALLHSETVMQSFCKKVMDKGEYPRLQVAEKDGHFFTLNNTRLDLFRRLQDEGYCRKVTAEKIPLDQIPQGIQQMMIVPLSNIKCKKSHGYQPLHQRDMHQRETKPEENTESEIDSDESDTGSDVSDDVDSESASAESEPEECTSVASSAEEKESFL